jgi:hypothetical protein
MLHDSRNKNFGDMLSNGNIKLEFLKSDVRKQFNFDSELKTFHIEASKTSIEDLNVGMDSQEKMKSTSKLQKIIEGMKKSNPGSSLFEFFTEEFGSDHYSFVVMAFMTKKPHPNHSKYPDNKPEMNYLAVLVSRQSLVNLV